MKILTPPLGLLEFLERAGSSAKIYEVQSTPEHLGLSLGCREEEILKTSLILHADKAPRLSVHSRNHKPELLSGERVAKSVQIYLLTGYSAEWMPPFGLPHLLEPVIDPTCLKSPCLYIPAGILNGWRAITPEELVCLTDFKHWSRVFAA